MVEHHPHEDSLGYILGRTVRSLGARLHRNFSQAGYDLTCEQWGLLSHLERNNGMNQQELAMISCKDKTSMVRLIDGLEKRKLVVRTPDKEDRRQKKIYLTVKGKTFQKRLLPIVEKTLEEAQGHITADEMNMCKRVLNRVYENLIDHN